MRLAVAFLAAATALTGAASAAAAPSVELRDMVARVTVIPEDRTDIKVELLATNPKLPLTVTTEGGRTVVDGGLRHRIRDCHLGRARPSAFVGGVGRVDEPAMPNIAIRAPREVVVTSSGAVVGSIGRSVSLLLRDSGCSAWTLADVSGAAMIHESGAGSVRLGSTGRLDVELSGAAKVHAVRAREGLEAALSGAGDVEVEEISGPLQARVSGIGKVKVANGRASSVRASVSGVGGVEFGGVADTLDASISGLGSVRVKNVTGAVSKSISGAGHVTVEDRPS
jgi:putative autotransporter adhesin-like protein